MCEKMTDSHFAALVDLLKRNHTARVYDTSAGMAATYSYWVEAELMMSVWHGLRKTYEGSIDNCPYRIPQELGVRLQTKLFHVHNTNGTIPNCP